MHNVVRRLYITDAHNISYNGLVVTKRVELFRYFGLESSFGFLGAKSYMQRVKVYCLLVFFFFLFF